MTPRINQWRLSSASLKVQPFFSQNSRNFSTSFIKTFKFPLRFSFLLSNLLPKFILPPKFCKMFTSPGNVGLKNASSCREKTQQELATRITLGPWLALEAVFMTLSLPIRSVAGCWRVKAWNSKGLLNRYRASKMRKDLMGHEPKKIPDVAASGGFTGGGGLSRPPGNWSIPLCYAHPKAIYTIPSPLSRKNRTVCTPGG